jgi:hypothetical protein
MKLADDLKLDLTRAPRRALRRVVDFAMSHAMRLASRM